MNLYTVSMIAAQNHLPVRRVRWHCNRLGLPKVGALYIIDEVGREILLAAIASARPGPRPRGTVHK